MPAAKSQLDGLSGRCQRKCPNAAGKEVVNGTQAAQRGSITLDHVLFISRLIPNRKYAHDLVAAAGHQNIFYVEAAQTGPIGKIFKTVGREKLPVGAMLAQKINDLGQCFHRSGEYIHAGSAQWRREGCKRSAQVVNPPISRVCKPAGRA